MPRCPRRQLAGGTFHVTARGVRGSDIYYDDQDRAFFLSLVARLAKAREWRCLAYCLMPNHYHIVFRISDDDLPAGMHWLNGCYAQWFNQRHGYEGHVFDRRFHSTLVESDVHLLELLRYVVLNPVRAGLCSHPGEWRWSSYRAVLGRVRRPRFLSVGSCLEMFSQDVARARAAFEAFVDSAAPKARSP